MCFIDINNKGCNVFYVFCVMDARWNDFVEIFLTNLLFFQMYFFQIKISILLFYITVIFWWRIRGHIVPEYNNENMRFICLLLANQIAYIFRSNDNTRYHNFFFNNSIYKKCQTLLHVNIDKGRGGGFFLCISPFTTLLFLWLYIKI